MRSLAPVSSPSPRNAEHLLKRHKLVVSRIIIKFVHMLGDANSQCSVERASASLLSSLSRGTSLRLASTGSHNEAGPPGRTTEHFPSRGSVNRRRRVGSCEFHEAATATTLSKRAFYVVQEYSDERQFKQGSSRGKRTNPATRRGRSSRASRENHLPVDESGSDRSSKDDADDSHGERNRLAAFDAS